MAILHRRFSDIYKSTLPSIICTWIPVYYNYAFCCSVSCLFTPSYIIASISMCIMLSEGSYIPEACHSLCNQVIHSVAINNYAR